MDKATTRKNDSFEVKSSSKSGSILDMNEVQSTKRHMKHRLFPPSPHMAKFKKEQATHDLDEDMTTDNFNFGSEPELDIICNMIYMLPIEHDSVIEVTKDEDSGLAKELANHNTLCYYIMKDNSIDEDMVVFERVDMVMQKHLKPLFIIEKFENMRINKVLVDGGDFINIMPYSLLRKIGKFNTYLNPNNMVLSNYEGKTSKHLRVIQVEVVVVATTRPTFFVVVSTKENYNSLLGR